MENKEYYILENNAKKGPFSLEEVKLQAITPTTKIWTTGQNGWKKAGQIPELQPFIHQTPPGFSPARKWVLAAAVCLLLVTLAVLVWTHPFAAKKPSAVQDTVYNNQQLYTNFSQGIVLIEHQFIYEMEVAGKKFYCTDFYSDGSANYLYFLTDDRESAAAHAPVVQGTGFFISQDGKILTNRHVVGGNPSKAEVEKIRKGLLFVLNQRLNQRITDSTEVARADNATLSDSTVTPMMEDAKASEQYSEADDEDSEEEPLTFNRQTIDNINKYGINVKRISLELRIFTPGMQMEYGKGINCKFLATSDNENVDLSLIQTNSQKLPDKITRLPGLHRIISADNADLSPQMSEHLILIGYNQGGELSSTSLGIKPQLTEGKISQNTDEYKLLYSIPTLYGSSGSPVFDERGNLVSVNFAKVTESQGFNYGIHPRKIKDFLVKNDVLKN
jgi:hypothetical protein